MSRPLLKGIQTTTLGWRGRVLHSQEATQVISSRQRHTAEERWRASLDIDIGRIRQIPLLSFIVFKTL